MCTMQVAPARKTRILTCQQTSFTANTVHYNFTSVEILGESQVVDFVETTVLLGSEGAKCVIM